jgi:glutathione-regulated potassium-efflux system ancillary protein KefF
MAALCRMKYEQPVYSFGTAYIPGFSTEEDRKRVLDTADRHAQRLLERLKELES